MDVGAARRIIQEGKMPYSLGNGHLAFLKMKVVFFQQVAPQGAKALLIRSVKSAFALLLARVTEPCRLAPEIRSGFEKDNQCNGGKRLPQS
jgi:hypothetical protein